MREAPTSPSEKEECVCLLAVIFDFNIYLNGVQILPMEYDFWILSVLDMRMRLYTGLKTTWAQKKMKVVRAVRLCCVW